MLTYALVVSFERVMFTMCLNISLRLHECNCKNSCLTNSFLKKLLTMGFSSLSNNFSTFFQNLVLPVCQVKPFWDLRTSLKENCRDHLDEIVF